MDINQIETNLTSSDFQNRLKAITALNDYPIEVAIPLLVKMKKDEQFLVRSFLARALAKHQSSESLAALLEMLKFDKDTNVRAEASNSLSLFGEVSIPHLLQAFHQDENWLVRLSILAVFLDFKCPDELFDVCVCGISGEDYAVKESCLNGLGELAGTFKENEALNQLLTLVNDETWRIRVRVAKALSKFSQPQAQEALNKLRQDEDYRVVAAVLEKNI
jgi:HEAT repeat protein